MRRRSVRRLLALGALVAAIGGWFSTAIRAGDNLDVNSGGAIHDAFWDSRLFDGTPGFPGAILWHHNPAGIASGLSPAAFEARLENAFNAWDAVDTSIPGAPLVPIVNFGGQTTAADAFALDGINTVAWQPGETLGGTLVVTPCWALNAPTTTIGDGAGHALMPITGRPPIPFPGPPGVEYPIGTIIDCGMRWDSLDFWSTSDAPIFIQFDVQGIATHEAGHFIGISHSTLGDFTAASEANATMLPFAAFQDMTFRTLEEDDKASVLRTYARNRFGGPISQTVGGRGLIKLRLLQGAACEPASGLSVVAYRTSGGIDGPDRVETFSGSHLRAGILDEPANGSATLNVLPLPTGESYTIYARTLEQGLGPLSSQRYNHTTINANVLDPANHSRTFDQLAVIDALESGASVDLGSIGILGCWVPNPDSPIDFVAQSVTAPSNTFRGSQIPVTSSFTNNGSAASTAFSVGVYFSADQTITSEDVFAGFACTVSSLAPGEVGTCNGLATVPSLLPGDYYAGLLVDFQNHIVESIETNNGVSTGHLTSVAPNPLDPIVNGSFETGNLTGWTVKELTPTSNPSMPISVMGAGVEYPLPTFQAPPYVLDYFTSAPTHGQWAVLHDFNGDDPLTSGFVNRRELYQDVTLPAGTTTLEFNYRAAWELFRFGSTQDRTFTVELEPAGGGPALFTQTILVAPNNTIEEDTDNPSGGVGFYPPGSVDLSAFSGQSVRLKFVWNIPEAAKGFGFFQLDDIRINANVTPGNTPPVVTLTSPADGSSFVTGTSITFAATANDAEEGDLSANLVWTSSVIGGQIGTGASFSTSALSVGTHTITASVTDSGQAVGSHSISVTITPVPNAPPTVTITAPANGSSFVAGTSIAFAGTATDTADGNLSASLSWSSSLVGVIGSGATFSTSALTVGTHTITASVTDSGGATGSGSITLTVNANTPPTVAITAPANGASFVAGTSIAFAGTANDAQQGNLSANLVWTSSVAGGQIGTGASFSTSALSVGTHTITASVTDSGGATGSASITLTVTALNTPPTVTITAPANGASFVAGTSIAFAGTANDAQQGNLSANLVWTSSPAGGQIGTGASFSTSVLSVGTHTITATATDFGGLSGSSSISVTVTPPTTDVDNLAAADVSTAPGTVAPGTSFLDTRTENDTYERLIEARQGNGGNARSVLSHTWRFDVAVGGQYVFKVAAHHSGTEDNFLFSYSRDNVTFLPMTTVTATADSDTTQTYVFPQDMQGIVYVRVNDTDNTRGNSQLDTLFVDFLAITSMVSGTPMTPPVVVITSPSNGASFTAGTSVSFAGNATDAEDGPLGAQLRWTSSINGPIGLGTAVSTSALNVGTHTITASVVDTSGLQGAASITLTINSATSITLSAVGYKVKGVRTADLSWSGATSSVRILRNGSELTTGLPASGTYTDNIGGKSAGSFIYRVCETSGSSCSNDVTVVF